MRVMVGVLMQMEEVNHGFGLNISAKKSEIWYIGKGEGDVRMTDIELQGQRMIQIEELVYLGSVFTNDGILYTTQNEGGSELQERLEPWNEDWLEEET